MLKKTYIVVLTFGLLSLASCAQRTASPKNLSMGSLVKQDDASSRISKANSLHAMGEIEASISSLRQWVDNTSYQPAHDQAYELIVEWLLQINRYEEARKVASYFLAHYNQSPSTQKIIDLFKTEPKALSKPSDQPANVFEKGNTDDKSLSKPMDQPNVFDKNETDEPTDKEQLSPHEEKPDHDNIPMELIDMDNSISKAQTTQERTERFALLADYALYQAPLPLMQKVAQQGGVKPSFAMAQLRLALHHFHLGELKESLAFAQSAAKIMPKEGQQMALTLISDIDAMQPFTKSIGIVLPLSGPYQAFGNKALLAMSIALNIALPPNQEPLISINKNGVTLFIADSKSDPMLASKMAEQLIKQQRVAMIIGEITNESSLLLAQTCQRMGVPLLSLARHPLIPDVGSNVFVFNSSHQQQMEKLADYAIHQQGHKNFAILFPRHNYGISLSKMFFDAVVKRQGRVTALEAYDAHETTFTKSAKKLVGKFYLSARPEYLMCNEQANAANASDRASMLEKCRKNIKPVVDFDALFIPEFEKIALVIPALIQEDVLLTNNQQAQRSFAIATKTDAPKYVQVLGTASLNDENLLKKIASSIEGAYFVDAVGFNDSDKLKRFAKTFSQSNSAPSALEVFAHDAVLLALDVLSDKQAQPRLTTRGAIKDFIADYRGQVGLLALSFKKNNEIDVKNVGFEIVQGEMRAVQMADQKINQP